MLGRIVVKLGIRYRDNIAIITGGAIGFCPFITFFKIYFHK